MTVMTAALALGPRIRPTRHYYSYCSTCYGSSHLTWQEALLAVGFIIVLAVISGWLKRR
jgi:hypothetical protein